MNNWTKADICNLLRQSRECNERLDKIIELLTPDVPPDSTGKIPVESGETSTPIPDCDHEAGYCRSMDGPPCNEKPECGYTEKDYKGAFETIQRVHKDSKHLSVYVAQALAAERARCVAVLRGNSTTKAQCIRLVYPCFL